MAAAAGLVGLLSSSAMSVKQKDSVTFNNFYEYQTSRFPAIEDCGKNTYGDDYNQPDVTGLEKITFLKNFEKDSEKLYKKFFDAVVKDLGESGIKLEKPEIVFVREIDQLGGEPSKEILYVVGNVNEPGFHNGGPDYSIELGTGSWIHHQMNPLMLSVNIVNRSKNPRMALYKGIFYSLATPQIIENSFKILRSDKSKFYSEQEFQEAFSGSLSDSRCLQKQVMLSLFQGTLMQKGERKELGISKYSIMQELQERKGMLRSNCINPMFRKALIEDYKNNPFGVLLKLDDRFAEERMGIFR